MLLVKGEGGMVYNTWVTDFDVQELCDNPGALWACTTDVPMFPDMHGLENAPPHGPDVATLLRARAAAQGRQKLSSLFT